MSAVRRQVGARREDKGSPVDALGLEEVEAPGEPLLEPHALADRLDGADAGRLGALLLDVAGVWGGHAGSAHAEPFDGKKDARRLTHGEGVGPPVADGDAREVDRRDVARSGVDVAVEDGGRKDGQVPPAVRLARHVERPATVLRERLEEDLDEGLDVDGGALGRAAQRLAALREREADLGWRVEEEARRVLGLETRGIRKGGQLS